MEYKYRSRCLVRQLDGSFKSMVVYANSKKELEQKKKAKQELAESKYQNTLKPIFSDIADEWNEEHEKEIEYNTWSSYQAPLKDLKCEFGECHIDEISSFDIQKFLSKMKSSGYARQTINLRKIVLNLIFNYAIINDKATYNPTIVTRVPAAPKKKIALPSENDLAVIKNHIEIPICYLAYFIMFTGCRRGEALAIRYEDIDFDNNIINIEKSVVYINGKANIKTTKTENGIRTIPLLTPLKNTLSQNKKGYIFSNDGIIWTKSYINKEWLKFKNTYQVDVSFLQLRHIFATFCHDAGLDEKDTQTIMGHSKIETTRNIYTHIRESRRIVSANKLNDFLKTS